MKGKFIAYSSLMRLDEQLKEKNNYVTYSVSTTGLDDKDFSEHSATRVVLQEYVFDRKTLSYKKGVFFDKQVQCSPEALQQALNNKEYDVFANAGINVDDYVQSKNVLTEQEFISQFNTFLKGIDKNTLFIANGTHHCNKYLERITGETEKIENIQDNFQVLNQVELTREFFAEKGIILNQFQNTLDNLNHYLLHNELDLENTEKIIGTDKRTDIMSNFVVQYGREKNFLAKDEETHVYEENKEKTEYLVEQGKEAYKNSTVNEKLEFLLKKGLVDESVADRNTKCTLNRVYDIFESKANVKGIIFIQSATTGFNAMNEPIQFSAIAMGLSDKDRSLEGKTTISFDINCSAKAFNKMITEKENGKFDAFAYTGIDEDKFRHNISSISEGQRLYSPEESVIKISKFLNSYNDFIIVTNSDVTQKSLEKIGNLPFDKFEIIDFSEFSKQYIYETNVNGRENALLNLDDADGKKFSLDIFAKQQGLDITNTFDKCLTMAKLLDKVRVMHLGEREVMHKEQPKTIEKPVEVQEQPNVEPVKATKPQHEPIPMSTEYYEMLNEIYSEPETEDTVEEISEEISENLIPEEFLEDIVKQVSETSETTKTETLDVDFDIVNSKDDIPFIQDIPEQPIVKDIEEVKEKVTSEKENANNNTIDYDKQLNKDENILKRLENCYEQHIIKEDCSQETLNVLYDAISLIKDYEFKEKNTVVHEKQSLDNKKFQTLANDEPVNDTDNTIATLINAINLQTQSISSVLLQLQEENRLLREQNATLQNTLTGQMNKSQPLEESHKVKLESKSDIPSLQKRMDSIVKEVNSYADDLKQIDDKGTSAIRQKMRISNGTFTKTIPMLDTYMEMQKIINKGKNQVEKADD